MNKFYIFLAFSIFYSCSKSEYNEPSVPAPINYINIIIGNESFVVDNQIQIGSNENCNGIYVTGNYFTSTDSMGFRISFRLTKKGAIDNIRLNNYRESGKQYESADFNPIGNFSIKNFVYNQSTNYLYFEFEGDLVFVNSNLYTIDTPKPLKYIKGKVNIKNVKNTNCTAALSVINFEIPTLKFSTVKTLSSYDTGLSTNPYRFVFCSDNGNKILLKSTNDLWNLPLGQYDFSQTDIENRIDFEKYIGNVRATQLLWIRIIDWQVYQTSGNYTIQEHVIENGSKLTKGVFNLNVYENGNLIHSINNAKFEVIGF
jgi:hypothetical protein